MALIASSCVVRRSTAPLSMMARWNFPLALGIDMSVATLRPPPDWPKMVTRLGSPPKLRDVVAHPIERGHDVEHAHAAGERELGTGQFAEIGEAENIQAVVDADDHYIVGVREAGAVENGRGAGAGGESAAVEPHHYGAFAVAAYGGREDVEHQAVFALRGQAGAIGGVLRGGGSIGESVADAGPGYGLRWGHEAVLAGGVGAVGDAFENLDVLEDGAADFAG